MQNKHVFEYAIIRLVPKVEREEFINIGVILFCKKLNCVKVKFAGKTARLEAFAAHTDVEEVLQHMHAFERIANGEKGSGPIGLLDEASRFRWLTATRSTILQASKIHPGFCGSDPDDTLAKLFSEFVES